MQRLRSRAVTLMADHSSHQSSTPTEKHQTEQIPPSLLTSPRLRDLFVTRAHSTYYSEQRKAAPTTLSPTSILDSFSAAHGSSPIWYEPRTKPHINDVPCYVEDYSTQITKPSWQSSNSRSVGLNSLILDNSDDDVSLISKFRSNLTVRIPVLPNSPADVGTKTWNSPQRPGFSDLLNEDVHSMRRSLSMKEMELSEDYTCVISHGPNPTTTHIFVDRVVESCLFYLSDSYKPTGTIALKVRPRSSESFLSVCFTCRKRLKQNQDIFIYRFCLHSTWFTNFIHD